MSERLLGFSDTPARPSATERNTTAPILSRPQMTLCSLPNRRPPSTCKSLLQSSDGTLALPELLATPDHGTQPGNEDSQKGRSPPAPCRAFSGAHTGGGTQPQHKPKASLGPSRPVLLWPCEQILAPGPCNRLSLTVNGHQSTHSVQQVSPWLCAPRASSPEAQVCSAISTCHPGAPPVPALPNTHRSALCFPST